jgi:hypothetical protein
MTAEQSRSPEAATTRVHPFQETASKAETQRQVWSGRPSTAVASKSRARAIGVRNVSTLNSECLSETRTASIVYQFPPEPEGGRGVGWMLDGFAVRGVEKIYCHARAVGSAVCSVA